MTNLSYTSLRLYRRLLMQARPYWSAIFVFLLLSMLATPAALLVPVPLKIAVDSVIGGQPAPQFLRGVLSPEVFSSRTSLLIVVGVLVLLFALLALIQQVTTAMMKTYASEKLLMSFRAQLFRHVQRLSLNYHDTKGTADSIYRIQHDAPAIQALLIESVVPLISSIFMLAGMLYVTLRVNMRLAAVALIVSPVLLGLTWAFSGTLRRRWREVKKLGELAQSVVQEVLSSVRVVKAFGREEHEQGRFVSQSTEGMSARLKAAFQEHCYTLLVGLTLAGGTAAVLFVGVGDVLEGRLTLGGLLLVMAYLKQLYEPLKTIGKQLATKQRALSSAERAFALLDALPEVSERPDARPLARARGHVRFENVWFSYEGNGNSHPVLRGAEFDAAPGTCVGIAGPTGAGKTTLVNLLTRFYDPMSGCIRLDGVDLRDFKLADLRNQFGIVLQEPVLFSASIAENIAYGRAGGGASEQEIVAAAKAAGAHEFIAALPEGYATPVGERGMRLSGGERQRISLARAFLKDAPLLILDEPTSSVDARTEASIIEAMHRLMKGRTTFMIAHRLGTLASCDMVLKVEAGAIRTTTYHALAHDDAASARHGTPPQLQEAVARG